jgi:ATP-binding cassette, subfamily A (ABC1), member 3
MVLITFTRADRLFSDLNTVQFAYGLFTPSGNLLRALLLTLNQSQLLCRNQDFVSYPGELTVYGGPILYLVLQILAFYVFLVFYDSGWRPRIPMLQRLGLTQLDSEKAVDNPTNEVVAEARRAEKCKDELRVLHLTKRFGPNTVVDDVSFGVRHGEILALLGPNGAGKSSSIDVIRGKTGPSTAESEIMIEDFSVLRARTAASRFLGVCPQFDTMDRMTVTEHLSFYARARGVPDVDNNVSEVIRAVGLFPFRHRMASKLSGGNQRKLSLGTAIIGNPSVLLLDEPSSGMDAVAKRVMWKVIFSISAGRSMVITTHSMEEASALADRAAIMAKRLLAIGDIKSLAQKHGERLFHIHLYHRNGAATTTAEEISLSNWVSASFPGARTAGDMLHGQLKFAVPGVEASAVHQDPEARRTDEAKNQQRSHCTSSNGVVRIQRLIEADKDELGIEYYSVNETTLEDVFLSIIGKHRILEASS